MLSQNKENLITVLQRVLFNEKVILAKIIYWKKASWLLQLIHHREMVPFNLRNAQPRPSFEGWFPCREWVAARQLLEHNSVLVRQVHPDPRQRDLSYCTQILALFLCFVVCDTELSLFMCIILFPSGHLQSNNTFLQWALKLCPYCKLKQVWKLVLAQRLRSSSSTLQSAWPASQHLVLCPCAIIILLWEDFFPAKNACKMWGFCRLPFFFPVVGRWWLVLQNLQCGVPACGGICGCKAQAQVGGWSRGSQPDAITPMLSAGNGPLHVASPKPCSSRILESFSWHTPKPCLEAC